MSYKPDKSTLIAYLYDELNSEEVNKLKKYLVAHPELQEELNEMSQTRKLLGKLEDEVIATPHFVVDDKNIVVSKATRQTNLLKWSLSMAASIALLMMVAYFTKFKVVTNETGMQISFGYSQTDDNVNSTSITKKDVSTWVKEAIDENNEDLTIKLSSLEETLNHNVKEQRLENKRISQLALQQKKQSNTILEDYVSQLKSENKAILFDLFEDSQNAQRQYVDAILFDFSAYLEEQRYQDLELIQTGYNRLKDNTEINQLETNQVLASLITTVKNQNN